MRSRNALFVLGLIGVLGFGLAFSGCSSDDRPTPPEQTINGQYTYVQGELNDVVESTIQLMASTLEMYESNSHVTDTTIVEDLRESPFNPDEVYKSDDWYVLISGELTSAYGARMSDSVLFTANGVPVEFSGTADAIQLRHQYEFLNVNTQESFTDNETRGRLTFSGLNSSQATISGTWNATIVDQIAGGSTEVRSYDIVGEVNSLVVAKPVSGWGGGCPASGSIDFTVDLTYTYGSEQPMTSSWDVTVTFEDGSASWQISDGNVSTSASNDFCTP